MYRLRCSSSMASAAHNYTSSQMTCQSGSTALRNLSITGVYCSTVFTQVLPVYFALLQQALANQPFAFESNLQSNQALRFEFRSNLRIESFPLQRILITKISNYKGAREMCGTTYSSLQSSSTLNYWHMITHRASESVYCTTKRR